MCGRLGNVFYCTDANFVIFRVPIFLLLYSAKYFDFSVLYKMVHIFILNKRYLTNLKRFQYKLKPTRFIKIWIVDKSSQLQMRHLDIKNTSALLIFILFSFLHFRIPSIILPYLLQIRHLITPVNYCLYLII